MCFDLDSRPPVIPIAGGALDSSEVVLDAVDGNRLRAFRARASSPNGAGVLILPDVRGLHPYFEELALRFAENGVDALAIDYFGRTAGQNRRGDGFEYMPNIARTTWAGLAADIRAGAEHLRRADEGRVTALFSVGFCFGGGVANTLAVRMPDLSAAVPFYGQPPAMADVPKIKAAVLAHHAELDTRLASTWPEYDAALTAAKIPHAGYIYPKTNHGFHNDTTPRYDEAAAKLAWQRTLDWFNKYLRA